MKVLLIDVNCKNSSTGKIVYDLYQNLRIEGHEAAICYGRGEIINEVNVFKFGLDWETKIHAGLARITGLNGYFSYFSTRRLFKFIKEFQPDVVHIHELHAYFVNYIPLIEYLKKKKIKTIWTFHCEYMYTGKCGHANECLKFTKECGKCPAIKEYPKSLVFDFTRKMFLDKKRLLDNWNFTIVTPSQWLATRVRQSFLRNNRIEVIHNGIDTENIFYLRPEQEVQKLMNQYNLSKNKKIVLAVAPNIMDESKGGQFVLKLSLIMPDIQFVIVGADETRKNGQNVLMIQRTKNQNELAEWYSMADCFVICSKRENFPTTCLEALCCGTSIVGFDTGGTKETAQEYGKFVPYTDIEQMKKCICEVLNNVPDREKISQWGKKQYSKENMFAQYCNIYNE